jgi:prepilin-type N-terminal cleavage/methylation domain-containing protein
MAVVTTLPHNYEQGGFTLVEVLVTLVLLSMVGAIVFGSLGQVLDARARLRPYLDQAEETALVAAWFRQTVQALIPDYDTGKDRFAATETGFAGLTASPLIGPAGTPTGFAWALKYDAGLDITVLEYSEKLAKAVPIARWPGKHGGFSYFNQDHDWRREWPPAGLNQASARQQLQLPQLVRLGDVPREVLPMLIAAPRASPVSRPPPPSLLGAVLP